MAKKRKAAESVESITGAADAANAADTAGIAQCRVVGMPKIQGLRMVSR